MQLRWYGHLRVWRGTAHAQGCHAAHSRVGGAQRLRQVVAAPIRRRTLRPAQGEALGTLRHGRGVHTCSSGDVYDGQWQYDQRHGRGKMAFARGLVYEGDWRDDKAHG